jgi:hypothetical protein
MANNEMMERFIEQAVYINPDSEVEDRRGGHGIHQQAKGYCLDIGECSPASGAEK